MSVALANIVDKEKLRRAINAFEFKYGVLESIPQIYIGETEELKKELSGEIEPDNFNNGRLFSADSELRWRKKGKNEFYALIICDGDEFRDIEGYERKEITMLNNQLSFYLWGEKEKAGDKWSELRIPEGRKYPVESQYAKIKVKEYEVEGKQEEGKFYRFCGFEGVDK
jgi:hypothetical protein